MSFDLIFWAGTSELTPAATWDALGRQMPVGLRPVVSSLVLRALRRSFDQDELNIEQVNDTLTVRGAGWEFDLVGERSPYLHLTASWSAENLDEGAGQVERVKDALIRFYDLNCYDPQNDFFEPAGREDPALATLRDVFS